MYWIYRTLLRISIGLACVALFLAFFALWPISLIVAIIVIVKKWAGVRPYSVSMGSAAWASEDELRNNDLDGYGGLPLGLMTGRQSLEDSVHRVMTGKCDSKTACNSFFASFGQRLSLPISIRHSVSALIFAPTGAGKGVSLILPFLHLCRDSVVVLDYKGENARLSGNFRARLGQKIVYLDPYNIVASKSDCLNPLDFINKDSPTVIDACQSLAKALVVRGPEEREPHWNDMAELILTAVIAFAVLYGEPEDRNLQVVVEIVSDADKLDMACEAMQKSTLFDGMLARLGHQVKHVQGKERASVLTTVVRHLRFLNTPAISNISVRSTFDPRELKNGKLTAYLIIPPQHMRAMAGLLRMWIATIFGEIVALGLDESRLVHFVLDEAASLGRMEAIEDAVVMYRGFGCRFQFYFQSVGQLKTVFPNGQDQTLLSNASQVFFAANDTATADLISQRLGEATIFVDSGGTSTSTNRQRQNTGSDQTSYSVSQNSNWQQHARRLLKPEEVLTLDPRIAITFIPGVRPIMTRLIRYYEEPWLKSQPRIRSPVRENLGMLLKCCFVLALAVSALIGMFLMLKFREDASKIIPASPPPPFQMQYDRSFYHVR
ncbi:MAG: type IV secretory system conjugative DNA transfer family protein [Planctomycetaceae bacterium]|nr:type IV secretory system conjugative DNA transfer family protein [Planctomycetaceae bacterium]